MGTASRFTRWHIRFQRAVRWEFWPWQVVYVPVAVYWFFLAIRARGWVFFSAANPCMRFGGLLAYSKSDVNQLIPADHTPTTIYLSGSESSEEVLEKIAVAKLRFPVVLKPDEGERGRGVEIIRSDDELNSYLVRYTGRKLLQAYIDQPLEMGVMYSRHPNEPIGRIDSIVVKDFPKVVGDGKTTLEKLILGNLRTRLSYEVHEKRLGHRFQEIPKKGEEVQVVQVGNHMLGMTFYNGNHLIDASLTAVFDDLAKKIPGFFIGRIDFRAASMEEVRKGNFTIIEVNGVNSEPCHIFHPGRSLWLAWRDLFRYWKRIADISIANHEKGAEYASFAEIRQAIREHNAKLMHTY